LVDVSFVAVGAGLAPQPPSATKLRIMATQDTRRTVALNNDLPTPY
jgi:hypothetical protein